MFDGINDPSIPTGGQRLYFVGGSFRVKIEAIKAIEPKDAFDGIGAYIAETIVIQSTADRLRPGAVVSYVEKMQPKYIRKCFANVKGLLAALFGCFNATDFDAVTISAGYVHPPGHPLAGLPDFERMALEMAGEANPLHNQCADLVCTEKPKVKSEGVFTVHSWHPLGYLDDIFPRVGAAKP
jgi:hypothetical protein